MIKCLFKLNDNIGIAPPSQKMPRGITQKETLDFFKILSKDKKILVKKVFKDCVMIEKL